MLWCGVCGVCGVCGMVWLVVDIRLDMYWCQRWHACCCLRALMLKLLFVGHLKARSDNIIKTFKALESSWITLTNTKNNKNNKNNNNNNNNNNNSNNNSNNNNLLFFHPSPVSHLPGLDLRTSPIFACIPPAGVVSDVCG